MPMMWLRPTMIVVGSVGLGLVSFFPARAEEKATKRRDSENIRHAGWEQVVDIPALKTPEGETFYRSAKVTLWVELGWLSVRRNDADGAVAWQVALAEAVDDSLPVVQVGKDAPGLEINFGKYFIREDIGRLRMLRQKKKSDSPQWPKLALRNSATENLLGMSKWPDKSVQIRGLTKNHWSWVMCGLPNDQCDVWVRLEHEELGKQTYGFVGGPRPPRMYYGDKYAIDEGDLFCAERCLPEDAEKAVALQAFRSEFSQKPAPPIVASEWFNSPAATSLESFRGKVVLLDFWGTWCGPCVANLPKVHALHEKYKDRG